MSSVPRHLAVEIPLVERGEISNLQIPTGVAFPTKTIPWMATGEYFHTFKFAAFISPIATEGTGAGDIKTWVFIMVNGRVYLI